MADRCACACMCACARTHGHHRCHHAGAHTDSRRKFAVAQGVVLQRCWNEVGDDDEQALQQRRLVAHKPEQQQERSIYTR